METTPKLKLKRTGDTEEVFNPITKKFSAVSNKMELEGPNYSKCLKCLTLFEGMEIKVLEDGHYYYFCEFCKEYIFNPVIE